MQRILAAILLACFGMLIPTAATPVRICLLEGKIFEGGFSSFEKTHSEKSKCCQDCGSNGNEGCCAELKQLPESPLPVVTIALPDLVPMDLPPVAFMAAPVPVGTEMVYHPSVPIRGPDSPAAHRALLAIWRI